MSIHNLRLLPVLVVVLAGCSQQPSREDVRCADGSSVLLVTQLRGSKLYSWLEADRAELVDSSAFNTIDAGLSRTHALARPFADDDDGREDPRLWLVNPAHPEGTPSPWKTAWWWGGSKPLVIAARADGRALEKIDGTANVVASIPGDWTVDWPRAAYRHAGIMNDDVARTIDRAGLLVLTAPEEDHGDPRYAVVTTDLEVRVRSKMPLRLRELSEGTSSRWVVFEQARPKDKSGAGELLWPLDAGTGARCPADPSVVGYDVVTVSVFSGFYGLKSALLARHEQGSETWFSLEPRFTSIAKVSSDVHWQKIEVVNTIAIPDKQAYERATLGLHPSGRWARILPFPSSGPEFDTLEEARAAAYKFAASNLQAQHDAEQRRMLWSPVFPGGSIDGYVKGGQESLDMADRTSGVEKTRFQARAAELFAAAIRADRTHQLNQYSSMVQNAISLASNFAKPADKPAFDSYFNYRSEAQALYDDLHRPERGSSFQGPGPTPGFSTPPLDRSEMQRRDYIESQRPKTTDPVR